MTQAVVLFGSPGSGKGTQASLLKNCLHVPHISTGDMLREHIRKGNALGVRVEATMQAGTLVRDEVVNRLVERRLAEPDARAGFILDGYPRTREQARAFNRLAGLPGYTRVGDSPYCRLQYNSYPVNGTPPVPSLRYSLQHSFQPSAGGGGMRSGWPGARDSRRRPGVGDSPEAGGVRIAKPAADRVFSGKGPLPLRDRR